MRRWRVRSGFVLGGLCLVGRYATDILGSLCMPGIVGGLHPRPNSRAVAEKLAEPDRHGRGHRLFFLQDIVKMLTRNPKQSGNFRLGAAGGWNNLIAKQRSGMSGAAVLAALCRIDHVCSFSA